MDFFSKFCNICYSKETKNLYDICQGDNEHIKYILLSFLGQPEIMNVNMIYLCKKCCEELTHIDSFREKCVKNLISLRQEFVEVRSKLELKYKEDVDERLEHIFREKIRGIERNSNANLMTYDETIGQCQIKIENVSNSDTNEAYHINHAKFVEINFEMSNAQNIDNLRVPDLLNEEIASREIELHTELDLHIKTEPIDEDMYDDVSVTVGQHNIEDIDDPEYDAPTEEESSSEETDSESNVRIIKKSEAGSNRVKCHQCGKGFMYKCRLKKHMRTHTGEKPFSCPTCARTFRTSDALKNHKIQHLDEKPFECRVCGKKFARKHSLNSHKWTHMEEEPRQKERRLHCCDICQKFFTFKSSLNKHMRIHTGVKPYKCDVCDKAFSVSDSLKVHKRLHTGSRPYKCNECDKAFITSSNLGKHKQSHTKDTALTSPTKPK